MMISTRALHGPFAALLPAPGSQPPSPAAQRKRIVRSGARADQSQTTQTAFPHRAPRFSPKGLLNEMINQLQRRYPLALLALLASAVSAHAGVITDASVLVEDINSSFNIGYNYNGVTGYHLTGGCPPQLPTNCTFSSSGTTDTTGLLTSASDQFTLSGTGGLLTSTASAYAVASLGTGSIGVSDSGSCQGPSCDAGGSAGSQAAAFDTLTFKVAGASSTTTTDIMINFLVHGNMSFGGGPGSLTTALDFGGGAEVTLVTVGQQFGVTPVLIHNPGTGWVSESVVGGPSDFLFSGIYAITGSQAVLGIDEFFNETCGGGTSCGYQDTGVVSFTLPGNVSYTSASGVFLTQTTSGTPEPGSACLIAIGMAGLAMLTRNKWKPKARE